MVSSAEWVVNSRVIGLRQSIAGGSAGAVPRPELQYPGSEPLTARLNSWRGKLAGAQAQKAAVGSGFHHRAELLMVVVIERDETEGLENAALTFSHWLQHFGHALHVAGLRLEGDFDEVSLGERPLQLQQAAGDGDQMDVSHGPLSVAEFDFCRGGCKLNSSSTMGRVGLGIMCHASPTMAPAAPRGEITEAQCTDSWDFRA